MIQVTITELEKERWEAIVGPTINDPVADAYSIVPTPAGLCLLMCSTKPYGGWLAKHVAPLVFAAPCIELHYDIMVDDATAVAAQVIETDAKITDADGWTYDLSAQWNIAKGWLLQIDNAEWTWVDTNVQVDPFPPLCPVAVTFYYALDYEAHTSSITHVEVKNQRYEIDPALGGILARQEGWAANQIVTQLQQCNNSQPGGYGLRFANIGYTLTEG